jgi:hypothetical protein
LEVDRWSSAIAQIPKARESHILQNIAQPTGDFICTNRETVSGVTIDLRAARLGDGVAGASSKVSGRVKKLVF